MNLNETKPFNIDVWKKDFVEKYNLHIAYDGHYIIELDDDEFENTIIGFMNNVNLREWHDGLLTGYEKFKFDGGKPICLTTEEDCVEFEKVFSWYIKNHDQCGVKQWKNAFVCKYCDYLIQDGDRIKLRMNTLFPDNKNIYTIIGYRNDVNFKDWHNGSLSGHPRFKFDGFDYTRLISVGDCIEFERVFKEYIDLINKSDGYTMRDEDNTPADGGFAAYAEEHLKRNRRIKMWDTFNLPY